MKCDKYKEFLTKGNMMRPNSIRLLDEMLSKAPEVINGGRVLDLGCGGAITSLFLARETRANQIFATDLWISATDNKVRIEEWGEKDKIYPLLMPGGYAAIAIPGVNKSFQIKYLK